MMNKKYRQDIAECEEIGGGGGGMDQIKLEDQQAKALE